MRPCGLFCVTAGHTRGGYGIRTRVYGFAGRCLASRPRHRGGDRRVQIKLTGARADDGTRTRDPHLGKVMLYQLSHIRIFGRSLEPTNRYITSGSRSAQSRPPAFDSNHLEQLCERADSPLPGDFPAIELHAAARGASRCSASRERAPHLRASPQKTVTNPATIWGRAPVVYCCLVAKSEQASSRRLLCGRLA